MASTPNFDEPDSTVNISVETQVPKECVKLDWWLGQDFVERCPRGAEEFPEQLSPELTVGEEIGKCCTLVFAVSGQDKYLSFHLKLLSTGLPNIPKSRNDTLIPGSMVVMLKDDKGELLEAARLPKFVLDSNEESQMSCGWDNFIKIEDLWMNRAVGSEGQLLFDIMINIHGEPRNSVEREVTTVDDLVLLCEDQPFRVHKSVICEASEYFRENFGPETTGARQKAVTLPDVDAETAAFVVDFIYTGSFDEHVGLAEAVKILNMAKVYEIKYLSERTLVSLCENVRIQEFQQVKDLCEECMAPPEATAELDKFYKKNRAKIEAMKNEN